MGTRLKAFKGRWTVLQMLFRFLWEQRLWWMIPLMTVSLVVIVLLFIAQQSPVAPFIYTLF